MTTPIPLNLAVEDVITEALFAKILESTNRYAIRTIYNRGGNGYLKQNVNGFNNAAKGTPFLIGTDLDTYDCAPDLINDWLDRPRHHNLLIRVAVREAESWILADTENLSQFLRVRSGLIPNDVESLPDPKQTLIEIARRSRSRDIREDICPPAGSTRKVGPNYNARFASFVTQGWSLEAARQRCPSLARATDSLAGFNPLWP